MRLDIVYRRQQIGGSEYEARAAIRGLLSSLDAVRSAAQAVLERNPAVIRVLRSRHPERLPRNLVFDIEQAIVDLKAVRRRIYDALIARGTAATAKPAASKPAATPPAPRPEELISAPDDLKAVAREIYNFVISKMRGQIRVRNIDPFGMQFGIKIQPGQTFEGIPIYRISSNLTGFAANFRIYISQFNEMIAKALGKKSAEIEVAVIDL